MPTEFLDLREEFQGAKYRSQQQFREVKFMRIESYIRKNFHVAKIPREEISTRRKFRTSKFPRSEITGHDAKFFPLKGCMKDMSFFR